MKTTTTVILSLERIGPRWNVWTRKIAKFTAKSLWIERESEPGEQHRRKRPPDSAEGRAITSGGTMPSVKVWFYDDHMSEREAKEICIDALEKDLRAYKEYYEKKQLELHRFGVAFMREEV